MNLLYLIVMGLIAGWLAIQVMNGDGHGVLVDIVIGILGGIVGGWMFGMFGIGPGGGMIGAIVVAFTGAMLLAQITRAVFFASG
jgi:uncharacterized membrane protein YeaQ/YmgE (transglycosylase-associated protein family)